MVKMRTWEFARASECLRGEAISLVLLDYGHIMDFLFHPFEARLRSTPVEILRLSKSFSPGERLLIRVALDIWSGSGGATVYELLEMLNEEALANTLNGLRFLVDQSGDN